MASYLVTGGAGFIGSHLVERLCKEKHNVIVIDNLSNGKKENLPDEVIFYQDDINNAVLINQLISQVDVCFHLAAIVSVQKCQAHWVESHQTNLTGTIVILNAARKHKTPIIYASSSAVYGDNPNLPLKETEVPMPLSSYAADKYGCELHAKIASELFGVPTIGLRFFNVYGPRQDPNSPYSGVISIFMKEVTENLPLTFYGDGTQSRDFIYVDDIIEGMILALNKCDTSAKILNLCTGKKTTLLELHQIIEVIKQESIKIDFEPKRLGDIKYSYGSTLNAEKALNFKAKITLEAGMKRLFKS